MNNLEKLGFALALTDLMDVPIGIAKIVTELYTADGWLSINELLPRISTPRRPIARGSVHVYISHANTALTDMGLRRIHFLTAEDRTRSFLLPYSTAQALRSLLLDRLGFHTTPSSFLLPGHSHEPKEEGDQRSKRPLAG